MNVYYALISLSDIGDKLAELMESWFTGRSIWIIGGYIWDSCIDCVYTFLTGSPTSGSYASAYSTVAANYTGSIYNIMLSIGSALMVICFVYGFCRDSMDIKQSFSIDNVIKLFVRLIISNGLLVSAQIWMGRMFKWAIALTNVTKSTLSGFDMTTAADNVADELGIITCCIAGWFFLIVMAVSAVTILLTVVGRFFKLYLIIPLAPVALATLAGGQGCAQPAFAWIKTFLAYTFEIVVIGLALAISSAFMSASIFADTSASGILVAVEVIIKVGAITAAVKGADTLMRRALAL